MRVLILLALLGTVFAVPKSQQRIVGGEATSIENYPYMANLQYHIWGIFWSQACGGSLINEVSVLTAAHCVIGDRPNEWTAILGTNFRAGTGGTTHQIAQLIVHERYSDATLDNDVAIMRLQTPAVYSNTIAAARIAGSSYILPDGTEVYSAGWGTLSSGGSSPNQLQHVAINLINQGLCAERYAYLKSQPGFGGWPDITDGMLCAGILDVGGKDACQGDSGGPLAHAGDVIVGITSWGYGCAHAVYPGVNARVSHFTDWIVANA